MLQSRKSVVRKCVAMVIAISLLLSVMMVEAFAARSASGSVAGYSVNVTLSKPQNDRFLYHMTSGERMIHGITSNGTFRDPGSKTTTDYFTYGDYNGWDCNHYHYSTGVYTVAVSAFGVVKPVYNGQTTTLNVNW
jgi:hypothetical protein